MNTESSATGRDDTLFVNRELSFLEFNQRIVQEAADPAVPLLERLKFISIVAANLDEFFMIRVAGLKQQLKSGVLETGPDGMLPKEQLGAITDRASRQTEDAERILMDELIPALRAAGIDLTEVARLDSETRAIVETRFEEQVFPMLTPMAVDPGHPFPFLKNRTLNLAVHLLPLQAPLEALPLLAVVQVPELLDRFLEVETAKGTAILFIEDVINAYVDRLFPGMRIIERSPFRVVRNWDLMVDEDEQEDLLDAVQSELQRRWRLDAVRLEIGAEASRLLSDSLAEALKLHHRDVQRHRAPLALAELEELLAGIGRSDLRDPPFQPVLREDLRGTEDIFAEIARRDILLHHPYESYTPVVDLVAQAARDPHVLAIKVTLYRTNRDSPLVRSLATAAENGKQVTALLELKARFDEEVNVEWARELEEAGVHVFYGMVGLKTHCKVTMVVRREPNGIKRYIHLGTGNYNEKTARIYSDLSFFTARDDVAADIAALFNLLTGYSDPPTWRKLVVAPLDMRRHLLDRIERARRAAIGKKASKIVFKSNAVIDAKIITALCAAAADGVEVTLLVRGPCTLRVGVPGLSDKITVRMIVDRFLEHSRVCWFSVGGVDEVFITSTDIMPRNFDRRVEVMVPIEDEAIRTRVVSEILAIELADNTKASVLQPDGTYLRLSAGTEKPVRAQAELMDLARKRAASKSTKKRKKKQRRRLST